MAAKKDSILNTVKEAMGIVPQYDVFDKQLIVYINSVFATLHQLGYGPEEGFSIEGQNEEWDDLITSKRFNFIKNYVIAKVHLMFDPPTSSVAVEQLNKEVDQYEWRITSEVECYGEED